MAGDWIKYRDELWTHPKFIAMTNILIYGDNNRDFLRVCCGDDVVATDVFPSSNRNENVTDRALQGVTKRALRSVALGSLLRVWFAVNAHCKTQENDAVMHPMSLDDLDEIAGFDGFGEAMCAAGWVDEDSDLDALIFRNFLEFNEPASKRKKPLTNAERQRLHRERRKQEKTGRNESNESNGREEKRRDKEKIQKEKRKTLVPPGWKPSQKTEEWFAKQGFDFPMSDMVERFIDGCHAKGHKYIDHDAALKNWAKLRHEREQGKSGETSLSNYGQAGI